MSTPQHALVILVFAVFTGCSTPSKPIALQPDPSFPAAEAPNYQALVSVTWVKSLLDYHQSGFKRLRPPTYLNERFVVLEAGWGEAAAANDAAHGHIPGAVYINTEDLENGYPRWRLRSTEELHRAIGRAGITRGTTVVVYGKQMIAAARVWWILKIAGVRDVRLLDGGMRQWRAAGYPVERTFQVPRPASFSAPVSNSWNATSDEVLARYNSPEVWLADVRSEV